MEDFLFNLDQNDKSLVTDIIKTKVNKLFLIKLKQLEDLFKYVLNNYNNLANHKNVNFPIYGFLTIEIYLNNTQKIENKVFEECLKASAKLAKKEIFIDFPEESINIFRNYFKFFENKKKYIEGKNYFLQFISIIPKIDFHPIRGYILFFSYLTTDYSYIDDILNQIIVSANIETQTDLFEFNLYAFYKGEILLNRKNFILASHSFSYCLPFIFNNKETIIDQFQIGCIKRLCLLKDILPKDIANVIDNNLNKFMKIKAYKGLMNYLEYNNKKDKNKYKILEDFIEKNKKELKSDCIFGLAKIALKELRFKFIQSYLKRYKRIKMNKLSKITNMELNTLKNILHYYVSIDKINIKYDQIEDIIDVIDVDTSENLDEIKKYYMYLNQVSCELYTYNKHKISYFKKINSLNNEEKEKLYIKINNKINDYYEDED